MRQRTYAEKIFEGIKDIDFAKERYQKLQTDEVERRQTILKNKLKEKGDLLLRK